MEQANVICLKFSFITLVDTASLLKPSSYYNSCKIACWRCVSPQGAKNLDCQLPHRAVQIIGGNAHEIEHCDWLRHRVGKNRPRRHSDGIQSADLQITRVECWLHATLGISPYCAMLYGKNPSFPMIIMLNAPFSTSLSDLSTVDNFGKRVIAHLKALNTSV